MHCATAFKTTSILLVEIAGCFFYIKVHVVARLQLTWHTMLSGQLREEIFE